MSPEMMPYVAFGTLTIIWWLYVIYLMWQHRTLRKDIKQRGQLYFKPCGLDSDTSSTAKSTLKIQFSALQNDSDALLNVYYHKSTLIVFSFWSGITLGVAGVIAILNGVELYVPVVLSCLFSILTWVMLTDVDDKINDEAVMPQQSH